MTVMTLSKALNAGLRKALEEAQAKLDAISNIERKLTDRKSKPEVAHP